MALSGFCDGHRGAFLLTRTSHVTFVSQLLVCGFWDPEGVPPENADPPRLPDRYQEEELSAIGKNGIRPLVLFGQRKASGDSLEYSGFEYQGRNHPVIYTYNLLSITAPTVKYLVKNSSIEAEGEVVVSEETRTRRCHKVTITFRNGQPQVNLEAEQPASSGGDSAELWRCPKCGGPMKVIEKLTATEIQLRSPPRVTAVA